MSTRLVNAILLVLLIGANALASDILADGRLYNNGGVIRGIVTSVGGEALPGAEVAFYSADRFVIGAVNTDEEGKFSLSLATGEYYVSAESDGFVRQFYPDSYLITEARRLSVLPSRISEIAFVLEVGGAVSGEIRTGLNRQVDFLVSAVKVGSPEAYWQRDEHFRVTNQGDYILEGLLPGYYKIFVRAEDFATQFYWLASTFKDADLVEIEVGQTVPEIDFEPMIPGDGVISGFAVDISAGTPIVGANVSAYQWSNIWDDPYRVWTVTDENGYFELEVTAGHYYVEAVVADHAQAGVFIHMYYDNRLDDKLADLVLVEPFETVSGIDFGIDLSLTYNLTLTGTIYHLEHGYPMSDVKLAALDLFTGDPVAYCFSLSGGDFTIEHLASGSYIVEIDGYGVVPGFWPDVFGWQDADVTVLTTTGSLLYNGGSITQDYGTPGLSISGAVHGPSGPLGGVRVYAFGSEAGHVAFARSTPSGIYEITSGLQEGQYTVFADLYGYNGTFYPDPLYLDLQNNPHLNDIDIFLQPITVGVAERGQLPETDRLVGNFPNPFNSSTTIMFVAHQQHDSRLEVYNVIGQLIRTLPVSAKPGINSIIWDGRSESGNAVASGVYFYRLKALAETRKMLLLK